MKVMVSCGEASGDLYAGALAAEITRRQSDVDIFGLGGDRLRAAGARLVGDYRGLAVTGLAEALAVLPRSFAMYRRLLATARRERPDVLVAIDFPDFNFRLAAAVQRLGIPVVYYVSPQLWAWRPGRIKTMKRVARIVLVIFPFEAALYRDAGVPVEFVGHPLVDLAERSVPRDTFLPRHGLDPQAPTVALLPGSRPNELARILPGLVAAAKLMKPQVPRAQFIVARAPHLDARLFESLARLQPAPPIVEGQTDDVLASCDVVVTASGTATVQAALHARPMVIVYALSPLTYWLGKPFVHVDTYGMANLVAERRIVPELIQNGFTPEAVAREVVSFLTDGRRAAATRAALEGVREKLGAPGASARAADAVLRVARGHGPESRTPNPRPGEVT